MIKLPDVTMLYVIVAFVIARAILKRFLFQPLSAILEEREREEKAAARIHADSLQELQKTIARAEEEGARGRREALRQREELRAEGRSHLERKLAEAHAALHESIERAGREIEAQAAQASGELPKEARSLARTLVEKILGRKLAA